jgi:fatty-acyl-CoA synthase
VKSSPAERSPDASPSANVGDWIRVHAQLAPDRTALIVDATGERIDYRSLDALVHRAAHALRAEGVGIGDRVALALRSEPLVLALYFAAARLGAILVPLNTRLTPSELQWQIEDSEPRLVIRAAEIEIGSAASGSIRTSAEFSAMLPDRAAPSDLAPGGEAAQVLMYTSGTGGTPKGALLPHRKTVFNCLNAMRFLALSRDDVVLAPVPLFHSFGLKILSIPTLFSGAALVLVDQFSATGLQESAARHRASVLGAVPVMYQRMRRAGLRAECLASLRVGFSAGAALDVETIRAYARIGLPVVQGYGQTETSILCSLEAEHAARHAGSVGRPVLHAELRIADESGNRVAPGAAGEIQVRGPIRMLGYWRRPDATRAAEVDGWHRTGDLGVSDAEGFVTLVGRLTDMYISGGENVYPAEVERVLEQHPEVSEAAVVGVSDEKWGEVGRAYVVPVEPGDAFDSEALLAWTSDRLAGYKRPRSIALVDELPRTASGKIQKHRLPDRA